MMKLSIERHQKCLKDRLVSAEQQHVRAEELGRFEEEFSNIFFALEQDIKYAEQISHAMVLGLDSFDRTTFMKKEPGL